MKDKKPYHVLLVEDDDQGGLFLQNWLKEATELNLDIDWACNYEDAKKYLTSRRPDIILSDYPLGMNKTGLDLANWLWARGDGIPMILIGGEEKQRGISQESLRKVVADYLPKSGLSPKLLEQNISRVMRI